MSSVRKCTKLGWLFSALIVISPMLTTGAESTGGFFRFSSDAVPSAEYEKAIEHVGAVKIGIHLYAVAEARGFELARRDAGNPEAVWEPCPAPPVRLGVAPALAVQSGLLYLSGAGEDGRESFSYNPLRNEWTPISPAPENMQGFVGTGCGNDHVLFFNGNTEDDRIIAYHRITDEWVAIGRLPEAIKAICAQTDASDVDSFIVFSSSGAVRGKAVLQPTRYHFVNHLVVAALLLALIWIGARLSRREKSAADYFRAGNRIPWWAAGLSLFAAMASAISLMSMPGKGYASNWIFFSISIFTVLIQLPILLTFYVPLARRLKVATANEYLERRFSLPVRMLGFLFFTMNQVLIRVGVILLLPSLALSSIFGLPMDVSILIMGGVTIVFVTMGGLRAVVWADVLQSIVMVSAILICTLRALFSIDLDFHQAAGVLRQMDKLQLFDFRMDLTAPVVLVLGANILATALGMIGDQSFIQRVQCTRNEKESRKAMITQLAVAVPLNLILFLLGTLLFLHYKTNPLVLNPALKSEQIFPFFAAQNLPAGLPGVVVAALLAATISTVAGALNGVANLTVDDVYRRFFKNATDKKAVILGRVMTIGFGLVGTAFALRIARTDSLQSVWDLSFVMMGYVLAPLTGIFVLGIFTKQANSAGVWIGATFGVIACYMAKQNLIPGMENLNALAYLPLVVLVCFSSGFLASRVFPGRKVDLTGLTAYTLLSPEGEKDSV